MKKVLVLIISVTLVVGMVEFAGAISFSDYKKFGRNRIFSWNHNTPENLASSSSVSSMALSIRGKFLHKNNTWGFFKDTVYGSLNEGSWKFTSFSLEKFGIKEILAKLNPKKLLEFKLNSNNFKRLKLFSSRVKFKYESSVAVPEPATLLLLGFGLIGVSFFGRKKFPPKSRHA